jgi:PAS domain S-box-containing protein
MDHRPAKRIFMTSPAEGMPPAAGRQAIEPDIDRFYRRLVRDTADAIVYADAEGVIGFWNAAAERIFGYTSAEAIGKTLDIIIPEPLRQRHWSGYRETVRSGKSRYGAGDVLAVPALRKDGTRISVEFTILPFRDRDGRTLGMAATLRDVTRRFEEVKALRAALAAKPQSTMVQAESPAPIGPLATSNTRAL